MEQTHAITWSKSGSATTQNMSRTFRFDIGPANTPLYQKLASHEGILIRSIAIADNLDEVIMLPQSIVFPLRVKLHRPIRFKRIGKTKKTRASVMGQKPHDQEEYYEEYNDYKQDE